MGVLDLQAPVIGGGGAPASPYRFRGSVLFDWMRVSDARSRALSVSRKDRGAILPLGRAHQQVYWYAADGRFTTSTYYADTLPGWVRAFNARGLARQYAGKAWEPLLPGSSYPEPDSVTVENGGSDIAFPHTAPADSAVAARILPNYPWMDELTLEFALEGVERLQLGSGPAPDLLAVSLSTTDAVGHTFGPDSRELHDQVLRLDRMLATFFQRLFAMRDSTRIIVALTGDHGVTAFPEVYQANTGREAGHVDLSPVVRSVQAALAARGADSGAFWFDDGPLFLNRAALALAGVKPDSVVAGFQEAVRKLPGVARADRMEALAKQDTVKNAAARRWLHMYPPDIAVQLVVTLKPHYVWGSLPIAMHGQPSDDDAHVPIVFYGAPFKPGSYRETARVVDMAPTLAAVLGISPTERLDGQVLRAALRSGGTN
jgi:hypothetical protein